MATDSRKGALRSPPAVSRRSWQLPDASSGGSDTRRRQNEGSIILRKDTRYEVRISVDGRQHTVGYARTAEEVQQMKTAALRKRDRGMPFISDSITLAQFAAEWLATKQPDLKESTYRSYEGLLRVHILPTLGRFPLKKITPPMVQRLYAASRSPR